MNDLEVESGESKTIISYDTVEASGHSSTHDESSSTRSRTVCTKHTSEGIERHICFGIPVKEINAEGKEKDNEVAMSEYSTHYSKHDSSHDSRHDSMAFAHGESGFVGGIINYTNIIVGSGLIGMPFACK